MKILPPRGTRDLFGADYKKFAHIVKVAATLAENYGYNFIETPIFENTNVFTKAVGETSDIVGKEMYNFLDKGGESLTLRPEGTAAVIRAICSNGMQQNMPLKLAYHGPMFRYERPQKGRFRQFYQFGIEFLGIDHPFADVEVIAFAAAVLKKLSIPYNLKINTLGSSVDRANYRQELIKYFTPLATKLSPDSQKRLDKNPLRILDSKLPEDQIIVKDAPLMQEFLSQSAIDGLEKVMDGLANLEINFCRDPLLVRGLDYYCYTTFEFSSANLGSQDAILGGGRYDGLLKSGGKSIPGVGLALGIDRLMLLTENHPPMSLPIAIIAIDEKCLSKALFIAEKLRANNFTAELIYYYNNIVKAFKAADRLNSSLAVIIGEDELKNNQLKIKSLHLSQDDPNKEQLIYADQIINFCENYR